MKWLTEQELSDGAAAQEEAWGVGEYKAAPGSAPTLTEGLTHPLAHDETGGLLGMMLPQSDRPTTAPRRAAR